MEREKAFFGWDTAKFHLRFKNGNWVSSIWGEGSYTENHSSMKMTDFLLGRTKERPFFGSNTVEIMVECPKELLKEIEEKYNNGYEQPIGHLTIEKWLEIINLISK